MFDQFSIFDVMSIVGLDAARIRSNSGYYDCPICGGKKKLNVNVSKGHGGVCRCAKCAAGGDKLDLFLLFHNPKLVPTRSSSQNGAFYFRPSEEDRKWGMKELERILNLSRKDPAYMNKVRQVRQTAVSAANAASKISSPEQRNAVYTAFLRLLKLSAPHRALLHERGLTDRDIDRIMFRSTPLFGRTQLAQKLVAQGLDLENVPGFFKLSQVDESTGEVKENWSIYCPDPGYFVPIRNKDGLIVSMQIRLNKPTTAKDKYRFFTSGRESLKSGISAVSEIHVEMGKEPLKYVYVTEGPIKGYVARALYQKLYGKDDLCVLCVVGTSNFGGVRPLLQWLMETNPVEQIVEFYDLDKFTNPYVGRDRDNLEQEIKESILEMRQKLKKEYATGKPLPKFFSHSKGKYLGKGVDDHLLVIYKQHHSGRLPNEEESL